MGSISADALDLHTCNVMQVSRCTTPANHCTCRLQCLALGAAAVLLGRPVLWGLALGGQAGVESVLEVLQREVELSMALLGCR